MTNGITYSKDGKRFKLTIDDFSSGVNSDFNAENIGTKDFATYTGFVPQLHGGANKRGSIKFYGTSTNYFFQSGQTGWVFPYVGPKEYSGQSANPIFIGIQKDGKVFGGTTDTGTLLNDIQGVTGVKTDPRNAPFLGGQHFFTLTGTDPANLSSNLIAASGTIHTAYTTGTVTVTTGSKTVTGSGTTFTSSMEGSYFVVTSESALTRSVYRIAGFVSTTEVTLTENYQGSQSGAGKSYRIAGAESWLVADQSGVGGVFSTTTTLATSSSVEAAWGGRLVLSTNKVTTTSSSAGPILGTRLRWSGLADSTEGTAPFQGLRAFHSTGYLDIDSRIGTVKGMRSFAGALVVAGTRGTYVIYGAPTFSGVGSLDVNTFWPDIRVISAASIQTTPYGLFILDEIGVLWKWEGSGHPVALNRKRSTTLMKDNLILGGAGLDEVALSYYDGKILCSTSLGQAIVAYDIELDAFFLLDFNGVGNSSGLITQIFISGSTYAIGSAGREIVDYAPMFAAPVAEDRDLAVTTVFGTIVSPVYGDDERTLRPCRVRMTYNCQDPGTQNPYATVVIRTGHVGDFNTWTSTSSQFTETSGAVNKTVEIEVDILADYNVQVEVTNTNRARSFNVKKIVIEGDVEGYGDSR